MTPWRYESLPIESFPLGSGPFRVRGLAYATALDYVDKRLPGGRSGLLAALGPGDPYAAYLDQIFVVGGDYDVSPLVRVYVAAARVKKVEVGDFVTRRSAWSAKADVHGVWKPLLKTSSPEAMAERLRFAFVRYFQPCEASTRVVEPGAFEGELAKVPAPMSGLYAHSTAGFVASALELAGAPDVRVALEPPEDDGKVSGVPVQRVRFRATWSVRTRPHQ